MSTTQHNTTQHNTTLVYLDDTMLHQFDGASIIKVVNDNKDEMGNYIFLDKTIFYPQGGGQPTDTGWIIGQTGKFEVTSVTFFEGELKHYGVMVEGDLKTGDTVRLEINSNRRMINSRNHTAGHALTVAVERLYPNMVGIKGFHFPEGLYVEFDGTVESFDTQAVDKAVNAMKEGATEIPTQTVTKEELSNMCKHVPQYLPIGKPIRVMVIDGEAIPCGGTHLPNTYMLGNFAIRKVKAKSGKTKVSYMVS